MEGEEEEVDDKVSLGGEEKREGRMNRAGQSKGRIRVVGMG